MDILIAFLIGLGILTAGEADKVSEDEVYKLTESNHDKLVDEYGDEYLTIVGIDQTEKD